MMCKMLIFRGFLDAQKNLKRLSDGTRDPLENSKNPLNQYDPRRSIP